MKEKGKSNNTIVRYDIYWMEEQHEIYGEGVYSVLGKFMNSFKTEEEAIEYINHLILPPYQCCTILRVWVGKTNQKYEDTLHGTH